MMATKVMKGNGTMTYIKIGIISITIMILTINNRVRNNIIRVLHTTIRLFPRKSLRLLNATINNTTTMGTRRTTKRNRMFDLTTPSTIRRSIRHPINPNYNVFNHNVNGTVRRRQIETRRNPLNNIILLRLIKEPRRLLNGTLTTTRSSGNRRDYRHGNGSSFYFARIFLSSGATNRGYSVFT